VSDEEEREARLRSSSATWREDTRGYAKKTLADVLRDVRESVEADIPPPPPPDPWARFVDNLAMETKPRHILRGEVGTVHWLLYHKQREFPRVQLEALHLTYVAGLTQAEAAAASRYQPCGRESYGKRLRRAEAHAVEILRAEVGLPQDDGVVRSPREVRRERNRGRR
jgi:hypothetical protein